MALRDSWHSALVYFGLAEDYHEDLDEGETHKAIDLDFPPAAGGSLTVRARVWGTAARPKLVRLATTMATTRNRMKMIPR